MDALRKAYVEAFSHDIGPLLPAFALHPVPGKSLLLASEQALDNLFLIGSDMAGFQALQSREYFFCGFWGHGINSHAFYYVRVHDGHKVYFRLPYGGVYMDNARMAAAVAVFLNQFLELEARTAKVVSQWTAIDSMHSGYYSLNLTDGKQIVYEHSLFDGPDFSPLVELLNPCPNCGGCNTEETAMGYRVCPDCASRLWPRG